MKKQLILIFVIFFINIILCCNPEGTRQDCGYSGINQSQCEAKGCCWSPVSPNPSNLPWCFYDNGEAPPPPPYNPPANGIPFNSTEIELMSKYFLDNIDIQNSGGVVASPDTDTGPGGSYYYHWMRDGALSMRALMLTNNDTDFVINKMQAYVGWVSRNQRLSPIHSGVDVRTEPKFYIPEDTIFQPGWCRPQTDGPGLRATTLSEFGQVLLNVSSDNNDYVEKYLFSTTSNCNCPDDGAIRYDLDWVVSNWQSNSCDLWEEITSNDFFWNRMSFRHGLLSGAELADRLGRDDLAVSYRNVANQIKPTIAAHWNGKFVYESTNREQDTAVILGFNDGYFNDDFFPPTDPQVAATINVFNQLFNSTFYINQQDNNAGVPGILYGRYQGDTYDGGNPWILNSAALAQLLYNGASYSLKNQKFPSTIAIKHFNEMFSDEHKNPQTIKDFARAMINAGDGVLLRIRRHVEGNDFHLSEQINRNTGFETSATDLTWSYATVLKAMHYRNNASNML